MNKTNEEKAKDMTKCIWYPQKLTEDYIQKMLIEMAEWKEQQMIEKACDAAIKYCLENLI